MKIIEYAYGQTPAVTDCALALGYFDGLHLGHKKLLLTAKEYARANGLSFGVFTFATSGEVKPGAKKILSDSLKAELLRKIGADFVVFADFPSISSLPAEEFARRVLSEAFKAKIAIAGFNYRFGKGASGDADLLTKVMRALGGEAIICEDYRLGGETVSTTRIRDALGVGDMKAAERYLGYTYFASGKVERGRSVGARLGFPTLNISIPPHLVRPKSGVYATVTVADGKAYPSITNLGSCPTFEPRDTHIETYLFDFSGDLYGKEVQVYFLEYLREEKRFSDEKELIMQINVDKNRVNKNIGDIKWQDFGQS